MTVLGISRRFTDPEICLLYPIIALFGILKNFRVILSLCENVVFLKLLGTATHYMRSGEYTYQYSPTDAG